MSDFAVAVTAVIIAGLAALASLTTLLYTRRQTRAAEASATAARVSADAAAETARIALDAERDAQTGWQIDRVRGERYALRNTGTLIAYEVQLAGNFDPLCFDLENPTATVDIGPRQAATFWAGVDMEHPGGDVVITWRNQVVQGQAALTRHSWIEQLWIEQLPPKPPRGTQTRYAGM